MKFKLVIFVAIMLILLGLLNTKPAYGTFNKCAMHSNQKLDDIIVNFNNPGESNPWLYIDFASLLVIIVTSIGFVIAYIQLKKNAKANEGELALKLDDRIGQYRNVYKELFEGGGLYNGIPEDKVEEIESYLTFYDTASILIKNQQIKLNQVNCLYGYRFMTVMHNLDVQEIIRGKINSWKGLLWLYVKIIAIRERKGEEIPRIENRM